MKWNILQNIHDGKYRHVRDDGAANDSKAVDVLREDWGVFNTLFYEDDEIEMNLVYQFL